MRDSIRADGLDPHARLHVYANAYFARIAAVLVDDHPKLHAVVGAEDTGAHAHADLARLERALVEAYDGRDAPALTRDDLAALAPEAFPALPLRLVPTVRLVELTSNADDVWDAVEQAAPPPAPRAARRTVVVWRRDLTVVHRTLEPDEVGPLRRLVAGASFGHLCDDVADVPRALVLLLRWLDAGILTT